MKWFKDNWWVLIPIAFILAIILGPKPPGKGGKGQPTTLVIVLDETNSFVNDCGDCPNATAVAADSWGYDNWATSLDLASAAVGSMQAGDRLLVYCLDDHATASDLRVEWEVPPLDLLNPDKEPDQVRDEWQAQLDGVVAEVRSLEVRPSSSAYPTWSKRVKSSGTAASEKTRGDSPTEGEPKRLGTDVNGLLGQVASATSAELVSGARLRMLIFSDLNPEELPQGVASPPVPSPSSPFPAADSRVKFLNVPEEQAIRTPDGELVLESNRFKESIPVMRRIDDPLPGIDTPTSKPQFWAGWFSEWGLRCAQEDFYKRSDLRAPTASTMESNWLTKKEDGFRDWIHPIEEPKGK